MKTIAENAIRLLVPRILDGDRSAWKPIDRIERRFGIVGMADSLIARQKRKEAAFLAGQSALHDRMTPDRLAYLHR